MSQKLTSGSRHTSHLLVLLKVGQHCVFKVGMRIFHVKNGFLDYLEELGHLVTLGPVPARLGGRGPRWAFQAGWAPPCALPPGPLGCVGGPPAVEPRWLFSLGGLLFWVPAFRPQLPTTLVTSVECPCVDSRAQLTTNSAAANSTIRALRASAGQKWGQGSLGSLLPPHRPEVRMLARLGSHLGAWERVSLIPHGGSTEVPVPSLVASQASSLSSWKPATFLVTRPLPLQSLWQYEEAFSAFSVLSESFCLHLCLWVERIWVITTQVTQENLLC